MSKLWNKEGYVTDQALAKRIFKIWFSISNYKEEYKEKFIKRLETEDIFLDEWYNINWEFRNKDNKSEGTVGEYGIIQNLNSYIEDLKRTYPDDAVEELFIDDEVIELMEYNNLITLVVDGKPETFILSEID